MYDDLISTVSYELICDFVELNDYIINFCSLYGLSFFAMLGIALGIRFFKDAFNLLN